MGNFFVGCYLRLAPYRTRLLIVCCLFFTLCASARSRLMADGADVRVLIPDSPPTLARDLERLSAAPFAHHVMLTIGGERTDPLALAEQVKEHLTEEGLSFPVLPDLRRVTLQNIVRDLDYLPSLLDAGQYDEALSEWVFLRAEEQMRENLRALHSLQGFLQRDVIAKDPFALHMLALNRFAGSSLLRGARLKEGNIVSADGNYALLLITAPTSMTDSAGAERFMNALRRAVRDVPPEAEVLIVGGHRHSAENAAVVKSDLERVLPPSLILSALICFVFIRSRRAVVLFILPLASFCAASLITALAFGGLSGIVLGFGGVLLGITADYAVHVYYALRGALPPEDGIRAVTPPLVSAALTTIGAFSVLFFSRIPVLSQLAVFTISGLIFALVCALCILPQFIAQGAEGQNGASVENNGRTEIAVPKLGALSALWLCVVICLTASFLQIRIDGDIRRLGYTSPQLRQDEERTRQIWGNARESGVVMVSGGSLEDVLRKAENVTELLRRLPEAGEITSLNAFLPSERTQEKRHILWKKYWERHAPDALKRLAEFSEREGFSASAFAPFEKLIRAEPPFITTAALNEAGFGVLPDLLLLGDEANRHFSVYILHSENVVFSPETEEEFKKNGAYPLSAERFRREMSDASSRDIVLFGLLSFFVLALSLLAAQRSPARAWLILTSPGLGLAAVFSWLYLAGVDVNIYHIVALPLVMGLGVDYGIFMLHRRGQSRATKHAVLVSALTTLAAFMCLTFARHPALFSLGSAVCCGVSGAALNALFLIPLLENSVPSATKAEG